MVLFCYIAGPGGGRMITLYQFFYGIHPAFDPRSLQNAVLIDDETLRYGARVYWFNMCLLWEAGGVEANL